MTMQKHFVTFLSPGTFVSEQSTLPIDSWNVDDAVKMAADVCERYGARPYGFRFSTRARADDELDSKEVDTSGIYYLGGTVRTQAEVLAGTDPAEHILRSNVRNNDMKRIIVNTNSWRFTAELRDNDTVLDVTLPPRKQKIA